MKINFKTTMTLCAFVCLMSCGGSAKGSNSSETKADNSNDTILVAESSEEDSTSQMAPDFTLKSIDGTNVSLSSFRGKVVVLDFWGSWCVWCIKGMPEMKKYYEKYSGKFEILGVDCSDEEQDWREAVLENELTWPQVRVPDESDLLDRYGINAFPTKIIIDKQGKILKTVVGEDPEFYTYLDSLMK